MEITLQPIGTIFSPHKKTDGMPIQPQGAKGVAGFIEFLPEYSDGLSDLDGFSHVILLYYFHKANRTLLKVKPFLDVIERGVFSTRAPVRPNHIGISVVELQRIEKAVVYITNVDILNETPLLDIKPYIPDFDHHSVTRSGWYDATANTLSQTISDKRFQ